MPDIRAIIFDLDDTLIEEHSADRQAFLVVAQIAARQYKIDPVALFAAVYGHAGELRQKLPMYDYIESVGSSRVELLYGKYADDIPQVNALRDCLPLYRKESWRRGLADCGIDNHTLANSLANRFVAVRRTMQTVFPQAEQTLQLLGKRFTLALLTNGFPSLQWAKIDATGLKQHFKAIIVSGELGIGKPDPWVFREIARRIDVPLESCVMVGDSLPRDIRGAIAAGMAGIWLNRDGKPAPTDFEPTANIATLDELPAILS